ncbi:DUF7927 domain-containing protein [Streptosporangium sp. NBC_01756]|uniref:DUF7927 domain-containing protein n=1 Tax=Streptosporangium sp. NBC_01756 TaxID=2975950 RepID=UPI002DDA8DFF|nr:fibronectin type III domain-containing protein [Streptosporangium sp. NBC_01756]WSC83531.1 putative Ig domain-containing protein [Streptosporangium sp. NBC_01756]
MSGDVRAGSRSGRRGLRAPGAMIIMSRYRRPIARLLVLALAGSALTGTSTVLAPAAESAIGTLLFDQPFHNNTANGEGAVVLPALPAGATGTNAACLTAVGNNSTGVLRSCPTDRDSQGNGKLRLTNATTNQAGGVFGAVSVPTSQGLDVTFNSYQYGGGNADGMAFVLAAVNPANPQSPANIGQLGGGLGYTSTGSLPGLAYGYLGIGLDVFGNYSTTTYQGSGCTNPAYIGSGGVKVAGQVVVRGPGNGTVGYCAINSTASSTTSPALPLRATTRTAVPVQVGVNPTGSILTTAAGLTIPPHSYRAVVTLVGGATRTLTGTLPAVSAGLYPASWLNADGTPKQLAFGWVGSTGAVTDFHELDNAKVLTISPVPELTVAQTSYNAATLQPGDPVTYTVVAGVAAGLNETAPISMTQTLPAGTVAAGAYGTGWVCAAPSGRSITCTNSNGPFTAGATLPPITVVGIVTGTGVTPSLVQTTTVATSSSADANPGYSSATTVGTLPATPGGITLSSTIGPIAGGNPVTVSGTNISTATAIEIGTTAQQTSGTPVVLLPCVSGATSGCFTNNGDGTLTIPSMPARATSATVSFTVVTQGLASAATYIYASAPAAPATPTATAGVTSATVTWTAPSSNGSAITGYVVTPYISGVAQTPVVFDASTTVRTLTGLTTAVPYTFTVAAVNAFGTGSPSTASNAVTPYAVPGKPVITAATAGSASALLTWTAPSSNGSAITSYVVTPYIAGVAQSTQTFASAATTQSVTGLTPGTAYTFTVTARNLAGAGPPSDPSSAVVPNTLPTFTFAAPPAGEVGAPYSVPLTVTGGTTPYVWSVSTGSLPPGLTLNAATGVLSGTPTTAGSYSFTARVTDASSATTTRAVTLVIAPPPVLTFAAPPGGEVSIPYSVSLTVSGGTAPYVWSITAGSLPPGLTLNTATGVLSGTPTAGGVFSFSVKVLDAQNQSDTRTVNLTIAALPTFTFNPPPSGQAGVAYSVPLTVTGGVAPYTWSLSAGSLPPGLTLNTATGVLSGTPTTTGSYPVTFRVVDANGLADTRAATLVITVGPLVITKTADASSAAPGGTVGYTVTVRNTGSSAFTGVTVNDALAGVLDDATYNGNASATAGSVSFATQTVTWTGNVAAGAVVTITYSVTVNSPDTGNKVLTNVVTSPTVGSTCPAGGTDPRCTATVTVSGLSIVKAAGVSTATPGQTIGYTVTVTNNGQTPYTGATFTDSFAGLLDDATYNADAVATSGNLSYTSPGLTWTGDLAVGASATITYSATVRNPATGNRTIANTISSATPGSTCPPGNPGTGCTATVTVLVPALAISSSADVTTTTPGSVVNYTVTASNTGQTAYVGASFTTSLVGTLDDATGNGDLSATSGTLVNNLNGTFTWTGDLAIGATVTITGSVTVKNPDNGSRVLTTSITSATPGNTCPAGNQAPACFTTVTVLIPGLTITKAADASTTTPGSVVNYTVAVTNSGQTPYTGATFADALTGVLDDATYNADAAATSGSVGFAGSTLTWAGDLAVGATATVSYSVTVADPGTGDKTLTNTVTSATTGSNCPTGSGDTRCADSVTVLVPQLTITDETDVSTTVPGGVVTYTLTLANTGQTAYTGISAEFTIAGFLDDATYNGDIVTSSGSIDVTPEGALLWTGDIAVGATVTIVGSVTVNDPDTGDKTLSTSITSAAPGSSCPVVGATAPGCFSVVTVLVPELTLEITADTLTATPGSTVTYTVTATNTGETAYTGAQVTDLLAEVINDAAYNGDATATSGSVSYTSPNLTWTGDLAVDASATITYSVTVNDPALGDKRMTNTLVSSTPGSICPSGSTDTRCTAVVDILVPGLTVAKSANATTTTPGATVGYTLTVTNAGQTPYTGATVTDALAGVLDDAVYNGDAAATSGGVSYTSPTLTWTGDLAVGASATITYTVTVNNPDAGNALLTNTAVSTATGSNCQSGSTDTRCTVSVPVARLVIDQSYTASTATPGSTITLNATFTNTGNVPYTGITISSLSAGTIDDAIPNGDQTASSGTLVLSATAITWTGNIPVGGVITVTGTLTVKNPDPGDKIITGTLVSTAPGNNCPSGGSDPRCTARLDVTVPGLTIIQTADTPVTVQGGTVGYTVVVTNSGQAPYTGATFTNALAGLLDDAVYNGDATATTGTVGFAGSSLTWTGNLAVGASATIAYTVTVRNPDPGDKLLSATISSPTTGSNCAPASGNTQCTSNVIVLVPALTITKTASLTTAVPGSLITYTVTAVNTGQLPYTGATFTDALAGVLDDAVYNGDAAATSGTVGFAGSDLTWTGDLAPGASTTVTYTATVDNPATGDLSLQNAITSTTSGNNCPSGGTDPRCSNSIPITDATTLTFDKVASIPSVAQGETVTYTVTISNSGLTPYVDATFTDSLTGVLDDATYNNDAAAGTGDVTYTEPELTWTGTVPAEGSTTVTYSVTANTPDVGDGILPNILVSDSAGGNCATASTDPRCTTVVTLARLAIVNTSDSPTYLPGEVVHYTTVMTNTGQTPYTGISVLFAGTGGVDDTVPNGDQSATSGLLSLGLDGLTWTGSIPVGGSVTLTGSVTVNNPDLGDRVIPLTSVSTAQGSPCLVETDPGCTLTVTVLIPELAVTKVADRTAVVPGGAVAYTVTIANTGEAPYTGATVTDDLAGVLNEATYNGDVAATSGTAGVTGTTLTWTGDLAVDETATVSYSVTAGSAGTGGKLLSNVVSSTEAGSTCPPASGNTACSAKVVILTPILTIVKTSSAASTTPGGTVTYTVTATNTGQVPFAAANFTDALAGVLDDAAYNGDVSATRGTATFGSQAVSWSGALNPGQAAVITYSVTVATPGTGDQRLINTVTSTTSGTTCPVGGTDSRCAKEVPVARITITNVTGVSTAIPTGVVGYTITVTNTGQVPYTSVVLNGLLAAVLDDATPNGDGVVSAGSFTLVPENAAVRWVLPLAVGATATATFSVTVRNPDPGNKTMRAVVTSDAPGNNCPVGSTDPTCVSTVTVLTPALTLTKSADKTTVTPGGTITYTIDVTNSGQNPYTGATVTDSLARVLTDATYNGDASATSGTVTVVGSTLTWVGDLAVDADATITFSVTVLDPDPGDKLIVNSVFSDALGSTCPSTGTFPACTTLVTVLVPALTVTNVADTVTTTPGSTVGYTVTIVNTGQTPYTGATVTDALAGILDDAVYNANATATNGNVSYTSPTLTWTGDLAVGASATITYTVTVRNPDTGNKTMTGVVASSAPGSTCPVGGGGGSACTSTVTVLIPALAVSVAADTATTTPGATVRFTVTIANSGQTPYSGATVTDALAAVLDDSTYDGNAVAGTGTVVLADSTLTWTGDLAAGASTTVTYTVKVNDPSAGDKAMTNVVASSVPGSTCPVGGTAPACTATVTVLIPALSITQSANVATITPGGTVVYTVALTNTGQTDYAAATVVSALDGLFPDVVYNGDATASTGTLDYTAPKLTWIGALAIGASATITYSVTVKDPDPGDKALTSSVTSLTPGSTCPAGGTDPACATLVRVLVPQLTITQTADTGTVVAGNAVHYTVTLTNTGETDYTGAAFTESLAGVLDDATYDGDATASTGTATYTDGVLAWSGNLAIGATSTVTYSVTTIYPPPGNKTLTGTVVSTTPGTTCPAGGTDPGCTTTVTVLVPGLAITKTADNSGDVVAGGVVQYTIVATNTGEAPYAAATFTDVLTGVLDDATYNDDATATVGTVGRVGDLLTWTGSLPMQASAVVTFSVTTSKEASPGDGVLDNQVTSATTGSTCPTGGTDPGCSVLTDVAAVSINLTDLTSAFTLSGPPDSTVRSNGAVTMTVTTNNLDGYAVTVQAASAELTPAQPGNTATIPVGNLQVRESGTSVFRPISSDAPLLIHEQPGPSALNGDAIVNDFEAYIPFVPADDYSGTLTYIATAK